VPQREDATHEVEGRRLVVHPDVHGRRGLAPVDRHEGDAPAVEKLDDLVVGTDAHGDEAVDEGPPRSLDDPPLDGRQHGEGELAFLAGLPDAPEQLAEIGVAERLADGLGQEDAEGAEALGRQGPRHGIGDIAELGDHRHDPLVGSLRNPGGIVEREGNRRLRDAGPLGNILYRWPQINLQ